MLFKPRRIKKTLENALKLFPVIVLTGARQTGKSTLLQTELPLYRYITFDDPLERSFALDDPRGFLAQFNDDKGVILDEIQYVPELFQYLKMEVDTNRIPGRWILTGSQQFHLMKSVSESLAGRSVLLDLTPFSFSELNEDRPLEHTLWNGLYPEPTLFPEKRDMWMRSYFQTYLDRDVRHLGNVTDLRSFEHFVSLCAARHSQELNINSLARDCGIANATAKDWVSLLESCYVLYLLKPFHNNLGKRLIKSPKLYFCDSGLASYLTRQPSAEALVSGSMGGAFMEGFVVMEAVKVFFSYGRTPEIYFWRSHDGLEVDLIIQHKQQVWPIEIKLSSTPKPNFLSPCTQLQKFSQGKISLLPAILVCNTTEIQNLPNGALSIPWSQFGLWLEKQIQ